MRLDKMSGLNWAQTDWHTDGIPEFNENIDFKKQISWRQEKKRKKTQHAKS